MSDEELRRNLKLLGYKPGPITEATRALYEKKLSKLRAEARRSTGKPCTSPVSTGAASTVGRRSWAGRTAHSSTPRRGSDHRNWGRGEEEDDDDDDDDDNYGEEDDNGDKTRASIYTNSRSLNRSKTAIPRDRSNPSPPKPREWIAPTALSEWGKAPPTKPREWITPAPLARTEWANPSPPKHREWMTSAVPGRGDWESPIVPKSREWAPLQDRQEGDYREVPISHSRVSAKPLGSTTDWESPIHRTPATSYGAFSRGPNDPPTPWARARSAWDSDGEGDEAFIKPVSRAWHRDPNNLKPQSKCRPRALEHLLSCLLAAASVALLCVFLGILFVKSAKTPDVGQMPMNCEGKTDSYCQQENNKIVQQMLFELYNFLAKQAGRYECGNPDDLKSKCIPVKEARKFVVNVTGHPPDKFDLALERVINSTRDLGIWLRGDDPFSESVTTVDKIACLESTRPELWLTCRLSRALATAVTNLILLFWGLAFCWFILALLKYQWRRKEEEEQAMYDMVYRIIDVVRDHYKDWQTSLEDQAYVAVHHVRDTLVPLRDRKKMLPIWEKAVKFLDANESRIRTEPQRYAGEDMLVWRWTPSVKCKDY